MIFAFDEFELDADRLELVRSGEPIRADRLVLRLLATLVRRAGQLVTKPELVAEVWDDRVVAENVITVAMVRLRKTLGHRRNEREFVVNVHGRGYRFVRPVTAREPERPPLLTQSLSAPSEPPFVGRTRVMQNLHVALQAARAGHGSACVLTGEAGIGKTRAVEMLEREAAAVGMRVAFGHCREAGATPPLWPFAQLVREVIAALPDGVLSARLGASAAELGRLLPELANRKHAPAEPQGGEAGGDGADYGYDPAAKHRIFDAVTRVLAIAAELTPWLLVLDDLHRADRASVELLRYLIDEIARTPVLLVGTARKTADPGPPGARTDLGYVLGHRNCMRIALEPLTETDVAAYVRALCADPGGTLARAVFAKSEGNPFYMTELARQLRDGEPGDPGALTVPAAALDLVRQRVARLDDEARGVLSQAAVIGRSFELSVLQTVAQRDPSALMASLDDALLSEMVVAAPDSRTAFAFGHELLRALLYDALPPAERRSCHLRVAQALEQRREAGDEVLAADLAYHVHAALPDGDPRAVVRHCSQAATDAARVYANGDVIRYLRHAIEALDLVAHPSPRLRMDLLLGQLLYARPYSHAEFERTSAELMRVAREQRAGLPLAHAALLLDPHPGLPPMPESRAALEHALELLAEDAVETRAAVLARLATSAPLAYDAERSNAQAARALELGRPSGSLLAVYTARVAQLYLAGGELDGKVAGEALVELEQLCAEHPGTLTTPPVILGLHRSALALCRGETAAASALLDRCHAHSRKLDNRELSWHVERCQALRRVETGRVAEGVAALRALHDRAGREAIWGTAAFCAHDRAVIFGELAPDPFGAEPPALAPGGDDPPNVLAIKLRALAAAGLHDRARAGLAALAPAALGRLPRDRDHLGTLGALARTALALGALEHARALEQLLAPYEQHFAVQVAALCEGAALQLLGSLAAALGRPEQAIARLQAGIEASERAGLTVCALQARLELSRLLAAHNAPAERARGAELERLARTELERLGLHAFAAR